MDAVQFGRWISDRRRKLGWASQRVLVESTRHHPQLSELGISEDFLARLEAGQLMLPFRGRVRQRVLWLAWLLCRTSRDVQTYLNAAELTELSGDEVRQVNRLKAHLAAKRLTSFLPLPARPPRLFGRGAELCELVKTLSTLDVGLCAITGMPGVGKSTLAYEAVYRLAFPEQEHLRIFPDGIATFSATGRKGLDGLITLLNEIATVFSPSVASSRTRRSGTVPTRSAHSYHALQTISDGELAEAIDRVRIALTDKRILIVLDDLDAQFPLRQALDALLISERSSARGAAGSEDGYLHRVVLATSRYIPAPALMASHVHLGPLERDAAVEFFTTLLGYPLDAEERDEVERVCTAVGYLPLAIEIAVTAVKTKGIPLPLLAAQAVEYPLSKVLAGEYELRSLLTQSFEHFDTEMQQLFALLATLGVRSFALESAAAIRSTQPNPVRLPESGDASFGKGEISGSDIALAQLANTAADLGQFVRHSLIELASDQASSLPSLSSRHMQSNVTRYHVHPLFYAYALDRLNALGPEVVAAAQRNIQDYALAYIARHQKMMIAVEQEREFLWSVLTQAWYYDQYPQVVRFVVGLMYLAGRHGDYEEGEQIIHWGIESSQHLQDRYHMTRFMNRLAILHFYRGDFVRAKQLWEECVETAQSLGRAYPGFVWFPLSNLAIISEKLNEYDTARRLIEDYLKRVQETGDSILLAHALIGRATYARLLGDRDRAHDDLSSALQLLSQCKPECMSSDIYGLVLSARAELARVQRNYVQSQEYTDVMIAHVRETGDHYNIPDMLFDQARFAREQGMLNDAQALALQAAPLAKQLRADHLYSRIMAFLQQLSEEHQTIEAVL